MARIPLIALVVASCLCVVACDEPAARLGTERWGQALLWSLNQHRLELVQPLLADDVRYDDASYAFLPTPAGGPRAKLGYYFAMVWRGLPDLRWEYVRATSSGDSVVVEWVLHGYGEAPGGGLPGVYWLQISDNRIARIDAYFDSGQLSRALRSGAAAR